MSPKKITDADKLEIVNLYRGAGESTASLAHRFGVSNSTVSRLLKNTIPEAEYDRLMQRKRGAKASGDLDESLEITEEPTIPDIQPEIVEPSSVIINSDLEVMAKPTNANPPASAVSAPIPDIVTVPSRSTMTEDTSANARRVRRRSSATDEIIDKSIPVETSAQILVDREPELPRWAPPEFAQRDDEIASTAPTVPRTPVLKNIYPPTTFSDAIASDELSAPIEVEIESSNELLAQEIEAEAEAVSALAEMFGEEIAGEEEEDFEEEEDSIGEEAEIPDRPLDPDRLLTVDRLHIRVTPLSEATLPRTCYIVIDKFAELIVRPLKDFADLGQIPGEEIQQRTLPIFDNPRVAKRFSNQRTQRVIKVPDSKVFHKTCHHLRLKGITRILVDGSIYSLN